MGINRRVRSLSSDNIWSTCKSTLNGILKQYPERGQHYVNINVLANSRRVISLDDSAWKRHVIEDSENTGNVYETVGRRNSFHSYIREYIPYQTEEEIKQSKISSPCNKGQDEKEHNSNGNLPSTSQRKGASRLLRSLKKFKQRITAPRRDKGATHTGKIHRRSEESVTCAEVVSFSRKDGRYIYASLKELPKKRGLLHKAGHQDLPELPKENTLRNERELKRDQVGLHMKTNNDELLKKNVRNRKELEARESGSHGYSVNKPEISKPQSQAMNEQVKNDTRKSRLKRQTVIRIPSNDKDTIGRIEQTDNRLEPPVYNAPFYHNQQDPYFQQQNTYPSGIQADYISHGFWGQQHVKYYQEPPLNLFVGPHPGRAQVENIDERFSSPMYRHDTYFYQPPIVFQDGHHRNSNEMYFKANDGRFNSEEINYNAVKPQIQRNDFVWNGHRPQSPHGCYAHPVPVYYTCCCCTQLPRPVSRCCNSPHPSQHYQKDQPSPENQDYNEEVLV